MQAQLEAQPVPEAVFDPGLFEVEGAPVAAGRIGVERLKVDQGRPLRRQIALEEDIELLDGEGVLLNHPSVFEIRLAVEEIVLEIAEEAQIPLAGLGPGSGGQTEEKQRDAGAHRQQLPSWRIP